MSGPVEEPGGDGAPDAPAGLPNEEERRTARAALYGWLFLAAGMAAEAPGVVPGAEDQTVRRPATIR